ISPRPWSDGHLIRSPEQPGERRGWPGPPDRLGSDVPPRRGGLPGAPGDRSAAPDGHPDTPPPRSRRPDRPAAIAPDEPEDSEAGEVDRSGEEGKVGADPGSASDTGSPAAVAAAHEMADLAFDLRAGGPVVGPPGRVALGRPSPHKRRLMGSD